MARRPTVYDVAERAGVSIATVSFAFRRPEQVREATREAVLQAARELGYVPNASARGLARGRTGALGLYSYDYLLDDPEGPDDGDPLLFPLYVDEVQRGVELQCWHHGYALMIGGGSATRSGSVLTDIAGRVDGLAVFPGTVPDEVLQHITRRIPVVEVSAGAPGDGLHHVSVDNAGGMQRLTEHLLSAHGLRDLRFVGSPEGTDAAARLAGFRAALRAAGHREPEPPLARPGRPEEQAAAVVAELLASGLPQALVCVTDQDALALVSALQAAGVAVPGDVAVTGFDGIVAGRLATPALTTVRQPMQRLGRAVVDLLVELVGRPGDGSGAAAPEPQVQVPLEVTLCLRASCGCPG